jgi:taurine dioxygenase
MNTAVQVRTRPLKPGFGAEILDVDLRAADEATLKQVVDTFHRHGAILLRGQVLDPGQLTDFIARFGEPEDHTLKEFTVPGFPKVYRLSNKVVDGKPIGAHNDGVGWHTDYSYKPEPVMATMLYAVEVPPVGSDTLLADCVAAWSALPAARQAEYRGRILHHSYQHFMRTREYGARELSDELKAANPDVYHPLVRTHPADGRKALWPSTGTVIEVMGMPEDAGLAMVQEAVDWVIQDRFVHPHKWQVGDILMWDNRCTLHTGTLYDDTKYDRLMHRLWVRGDRPY